MKAFEKWKMENIKGIKENKMNVAKKIKDLDEYSGKASLYKLSPPLGKHNFVVVSAANVMFSGPETYIFPANKSGKVTDWGELKGSFRGALDHRQALSNAGYILADSQKIKGEVTIKGWIDPRKGDELVVGIIIGLPDDHETKEGISRILPNIKQALCPMTKGFSYREHYILWEDGSKTGRFSCSGPGPNHPAPNRPSVRAIIDPLPKVEVFYENETKEAS